MASYEKHPGEKHPGEKHAASMARFNPTNEADMQRYGALKMQARSASSLAFQDYVAALATHHRQFKEMAKLVQGSLHYNAETGIAKSFGSDDDGVVVPAELRRAYDHSAAQLRRAETMLDDVLHSVLDAYGLNAENIKSEVIDASKKKQKTVLDIKCELKNEAADLGRRQSFSQMMDMAKRQPADRQFPVLVHKAPLPHQASKSAH